MNSSDVSTGCVIEKYKSWYDESYRKLDEFILVALVSSTRADKELWQIMDFDDSRSDFMAGNVRITHGQLLTITSTLCRESLVNLELSLAGRHSPVPDQDVHDEMCSNFCLMNDWLRETALIKSGCTCSELASKAIDLEPTGKEKWCDQNSGNILCEELGRCGKWQCHKDDFSCKRREFNSTYTPLKGYGWQCSGGNVPMTDLTLIIMLCFLMLILLING
jgi:hypothetical protein